MYLALLWFGIALAGELGIPLDTGSIGDENNEQLRETDEGIHIFNFSTRRPNNAGPVDPGWNKNPNTLRLLDLYKEDADLGGLVDDIHHVCPEWVPCVDSEPTFQDDVKCCLVCSCDVTCHVTQNCCPGVVQAIDNATMRRPRSGFPPNNSGIETVCMKPIYFMYDPKTLFEIDLKEREYEFINSCPHGSDSTSKAKCSAHPTFGVNDGITYAFVDIMAVTDVNTGTNYVNRHCAACHGVNTADMEFWEPIISCNVRMNDLEVTRFEATAQQREDCYVQFTPPIDVIDVNASTCISGVVSECNVTGKWRMYDAQIEANCKSIQWVYSVSQIPPEYDYAVARYENIFCAICNGDTFLKPNNIRACPYDDVGNLKSYPFIGMMNYGGFTSAKQLDSENEQMCQMDRRFEPIQGRCERVICSFPMIWNVVTQTCVDIYREINYGLFQIPFEVKLSEPVGIAVVNEYQAQLVTKLKDNALRGVCRYSSIFFKSSTTSFKTVRTTPDVMNIDSLVLTIYASVDIYKDFRYNPREVYTSLINNIVNFNKNLFPSVHEIIHLNTDTFFLPEEFDKNIEYITFYVSLNSAQLGLTELNVDFLIFEDPYDGSVILGNNLSFPVFNYGDCSKYNTIFDDTFLDCPAFMYNMTEYGIERAKHGITFTKQNVTVNFQNFRSLNHTHCVVCINAIEYLGAPGNNHANTIQHILIYEHGLLRNIILFCTVVAILQDMNT